MDLAEEAAQEAFAIAAERWPRDGKPSNPHAWLVTTGRNRAIDVFSWEAVAAQTVRVYERAIARRGPAEGEAQC